MRICLGSRRWLFVVSALVVCAVDTRAQTQPTSPTGAAVPGQPTPPRAARPGGDPAKGTATIRGYVVAADTGTPLRRVRIRATTSNGQDTVTTTTDDQGRFELTELVGGRYTVMAFRTGFVTLQYGQRRPGERGTPVDVAPGATVEKIVIGLPRGGVIAGRVMDDRGEPLAGALVQVLRASFGPRGRQMQPAGGMDNTDDLGGFRIYGLSPGTYVVSAGTPEQTMMGPPGTRSQDDPQGLAVTYFPGTPIVADAQRVTVAVGQEVTGLVFGLTTTRLSRIRGRVLGPMGSAATGMVMARPGDMAQINMVIRSAPISADGSFEFAGISPGRYQLQVGNRKEEDLIGITAVTVSGADLDGITIPLQRPGMLSGRFEFEGGTPPGVTPAQVRLFMNALDPSGGMTMMRRPPETADDFTFRARGAYGPSYVRAGPPPGWFLKAVFIDGQDHRLAGEPATRRGRP